MWLSESLEGKRDSRHSATRFSENAVLAETSFIKRKKFYHCAYFVKKKKKNEWNEAFRGVLFLENEPRA